MKRKLSELSLEELIRYIATKDIWLNGFYYYEESGNFCVTVRYYKKYRKHPQYAYHISDDPVKALRIAYRAAKKEKM